MSKSPTAWVTNPLASTSNIIEYDVSTEKYDNAAQPYDGVNNNPSPTTWKNPTAYTPLSELYQQYYGGPTTVPLFAAPLHWVANPGEINQAGQYVEANSAEADLYEYDGTQTGTSYSNPTVKYGSSSICTRQHRYVHPL
jgi:hypothetical protein